MQIFIIKENNKMPNELLDFGNMSNTALVAQFVEFISDSMLPINKSDNSASIMWKYQDKLLKCIDIAIILGKMLQETTLEGTMNYYRYLMPNGQRITILFGYNQAQAETFN